MRKTIGSARQNALIAILIKKREGSGMTQAALAKTLKQHQSFVARIESGQRRVDVIELLQLSEVLDFDPAKLVREVQRFTDRT